MTRRYDNAVRKEDWDMENAVQEIHPMPAIDALGPRGVSEVSHTGVEPPASPKRAYAPLAILGFLVILFFVSPYLPMGVREYISALVR